MSERTRKVVMPHEPVAGSRDLDRERAHIAPVPEVHGTPGPELGRTDLSWYRFAACRGMDADPFFPLDRGLTPEAAAACGVCAVTQECLETGATMTGTWGGVGESARRNARKNAARGRRAGAGTR